MMYDVGPQARRVYDALRERMRSGAAPPGSRLPSHRELAAAFGVAPLTARHALSELEREGFVVREQGRGTFVRAHTVPAVLVVDDELPQRVLLADHVERLGYRPLPAATPADALALLEADPSIALILSDVRLPTPAEGVAFIRAAQHRWPRVPLAAVTGYPDDLADLLGTPECPVLVLPKPVWAHQIETIVRLALRTPEPRPAASGA